MKCSMIWVLHRYTNYAYYNIGREVNIANLIACREGVKIQSYGLTYGQIDLICLLDGLQWLKANKTLNNKNSYEILAAIQFVGFLLLAREF